ncbi:uncharacterized protein LOC9637441 [Selaginella moellendorffii]|uniref:uncharacterized protein LOC9637441 n=1 Tax=Selaginella moellendorffii TaxID=88036 RepID=UPI000D1C5A31|nr:uncharacterized protein LOC9637441 [Selaginella moellendorffii]|eukprot:XP_024533689.1 uncharacterized protein LOC9637441 [Selaginella moellendorffii]
MEELREEDNGQKLLGDDSITASTQRTMMESSWYEFVDHQTSSSMAMDSSKAKVFYKTKLCSKFIAGSCPFEARCNFAHGVEELRRPAADLVAAGPSFPLDPAAQSFKTRPCKFFREGSCPYADRCTFLHDEAPSSSCSSIDHSSIRPPNWKTRICNQWESSGRCSFGGKCHFAHGAGGKLFSFLAFVAKFFLCSPELQKADNFQHKQLAEAAIYDCGFAWSSIDSYDWTPQGDQQLDFYTQQSQYSTDCPFQFPYLRPQLYGYGVYPALQNGFVGNGSSFQEQDDGRRYGDL